MAPKTISSGAAIPIEPDPKLLEIQRELFPRSLTTTELIGRYDTDKMNSELAAVKVKPVMEVKDM